jgi:hypothetical protein
VNSRADYQQRFKALTPVLDVIWPGINRTGSGGLNPAADQAVMAESASAA